MSNVDVLIIGAGPAGLMAANWMSRLGIKTRIVDKRADKVNAGQADGIQARTMEIWDSFGIADRLLKECNPLHEICFWNSDNSGKIQRQRRMPIDPIGVSRYDEVVLHQGKVEEFLLETIHEHSDIRVERATLPETLEIDEKAGVEYPVTVTLRHLRKEDATQTKGEALANGLYRSNLVKDDTEDLIQKGREHGGESEVVNAKYVIGCDGAHSWTRTQLGFAMEGEHTDYIWGVLDIIPITDFPDIRSTCTIQSSSGSILCIPRENKLIRLYVQLDNIPASRDTSKTKASSITPEIILASAQKIFHPYKINYKHSHWWTVYRIGQRVSNHFSASNRVFLAGDAVHTHSPKAGQGQNVSMQDTYNLAWKIGMVLRGEVKEEVLETYTAERRKLAQRLIDFDHKLSRLYSRKEGDEEVEFEGSKTVEEIYAKNGEFLAGTGVLYSPNLLTSSAAKQHLATGAKLGMRLPSALIIAQADARPWELQALFPSTGHFRILVLPGDITQAALLSRADILGDFLGGRLLPRYTKAKRCAIEVLMLHCAPRDSVRLLEDVTGVYLPFDEEMGYDYGRTFAEAKHSGSEGKAYELLGVGKEKGAVIIVRPDGYVGFVGELEDREDVQKYFDGILVKQV